MATLPASADKVELVDRPDKYPAFLDITDVQANNGARRFGMTVHVRDLRRGAANLRVIIDTKAQGGSGYLLLSFHTVEGDVTSLYRFRRPGGWYNSVPCKRLEGQEFARAASKYVVGFPQRCLGADAGTMRLTIGVQKYATSRVDTLRPLLTLRRG